MFFIVQIASAYHEDKVYTSASSSDDFEADKVMVVLSHEASMNDKIYSRRDFKNISCNYVSELFANADQSSKDKDYKKILRLDLKTDSKEKVLDVCDKLMSRDDVLYAGPDFKFTASSTTPNDTYVNKQWAINYINLPQTWDYVTGSSSVLVGVVDSGIDKSHPDLTCRYNETLSKSFITADSNQYYNNAGFDGNGHGTHVAGIIGAAGNSGVGVCGTNWNVQLVSLKVLNTKGEGNLSSVFDAVNHANIKNIPILNSSLEIDKKYSKEFEFTFENIVKSYNGLYINSSGNYGDNIDDPNNSNNCYLSNISADNFISVGAIKSNNDICNFSNYGSDSVDIYAPGFNILSTYPSSKCSENLVFPDGTKWCEIGDEYKDILNDMADNNEITIEELVMNFDQYSSTDPYNLITQEEVAFGYHYMSGTSMAAPYVSGVAALLLAHNPELSAIELKNAILNGSDTISATLPNQSTQTVKKLNSFKALNLTHTYTCVKTSTKHTFNCDCGYSFSEAHDFSYIWLNGSSHRATCIDCSYRTTKPHAALSGTRTCVVCGGRVDVGLVGTYSWRNRIYITASGSYILPNGNIILVEEDLEDYLNGTLIY